LKSFLSWINVQAGYIRPIMTINTTKTLIPPLNETLFTKLSNITSDFSKQIDDGKKSVDDYVQSAYSAGIFIVTVPIAFLALTVSFAMCNVRTCFPLINSCVHYLLFIVVSLCATVFYVIAMLLTDVCGERDLFLSNPNAPGLISLAGIPLCNATFPFDQIKTQITEVITTQAANSCDGMQAICDTSSTYSLAAPNIVFQCSISSPSADCPTFAAAYSQGNALTLKTGASVITTCLNGSASVTPCNLGACASYCTNAPIAAIASTANTLLGYANNAQIAYDVYVSPLLDCGVVYRQALGPISNCMPFANSLYLLGSSLFGFTVSFLWGIWILWRGQKRYFRRSLSIAPF
jgi:hypothetical protein